MSRARSRAYESIGQTLLKLALGDEKTPPDKTILIFLAKTRCQYKETVVNENVSFDTKVRFYLPEESFLKWKAK